MTRALARELGGRGITVNTVAPGYMETDLVAHMDPAKAKADRATYSAWAAGYGR